MSSRRNCYNCNHYDKNDHINAFGTCEILDADFHCTHLCSCPNSEIELIESLQKERDEKKGAMQHAE